MELNSIHFFLFFFFSLTVPFLFASKSKERQSNENFRMTGSVEILNIEPSKIEWNQWERFMVKWYVSSRWGASFLVSFTFFLFFYGSQPLDTKKFLKILSCTRILSMDSRYFPLFLLSTCSALNNVKTTIFPTRNWLPDDHKRLKKTLKPFLAEYSLTKKNSLLKQQRERLESRWTRSSIKSRKFSFSFPFLFLLFPFLLFPFFLFPFLFSCLSFEHILHVGNHLLTTISTKRTSKRSKCSRKGMILQPTVFGMRWFTSTTTRPLSLLYSRNLFGPV